MPSELQLVNRALAELGKPAVSKLSDSFQAQYLANKIAELHPELLLCDNWVFAEVYVSNSTPLSNNFSPDYVYSYQLPANFGRFYRWATSGAQYPIYQFCDGLLLANTNPVMYWYIVNDAAYTVLPPLYARALVLYAAAKSAPTLTNDVALAKYLDNEYEKMINKAIKFNATQRPIVGMPYNDFQRITFV